MALGIDVALARFQGADHFPYPVQFVTRQVLVDVAGLEDVSVLHLRRPELVVVVGNVDFLLADQLPVVAVRRAVVHVGVVGGTQAIRGGARPVIGDLWSTAHPTLAGVVGPDITRCLELVDGLVGQQHIARKARRRRHCLLHVHELVGAFFRVHIRHLLREGEVLIHQHDGVGTIDLGCCLGDGLGVVGASIARLVVPHHLDATLGDRERVVAGGAEIGQAIAVVHQLRGHGALLGDVIDFLWRCSAALGLVHRDLVGVRVALEHRLLARGQLVLVLVDVGGRNDEQRCVAGKRIAQKAIGIDRRRIGLQAAGPGRDAAVGVTFLLCAQRRQGGAQLGRFLG
ncbi:hypothetical protein D9M71_427690 [compost metagenome]